MASQWINQFNKMHEHIKNRHFQIFGQNLQSHSIFLPRYLRNLKPPLDEIHDDSIYIKIARYVSLIPQKYLTDELNYTKQYYFDCQQILDMRSGDIDEHSILLCNYFNYIDSAANQYQSYLVYGYSIPYGKCAFVLRKSKNQQNSAIEIWDSVLGECYKYQNKHDIQKICFCIVLGQPTSQAVNNDQACNLTDIGVVVSNNNVWGNIQGFSSPGTMQWDFNDQSCWLPVINNSIITVFFPNGLVDSVQPEQLVYELVPNDYVQRLEIMLQNYIMEKIQLSRVQTSEGQLPNYTKFNKGASDRIKTLVIPSLESFKYKIKVSGFDQNSQEGQNFKRALSQLIDIKNEFKKEENNNKKIYGFPLNMTYTNKENIWKEIMNTEIDQILKNDMEFIVSVNCFQYPNYIISVWVFIAVLIEDEF